MTFAQISLITAGVPTSGLPGRTLHRLIDIPSQLLQPSPPVNFQLSSSVIPQKTLLESSSGQASWEAQADWKPIWSSGRLLQLGWCGICPATATGASAGNGTNFGSSGSGAKAAHRSWAQNAMHRCWFCKIVTRSASQAP